MEEKLLEYLKNNKQAKTWELADYFKKDRTTIYRHLKKLIAKWKIEQIKKGTYRIKKDPLKYFDIPTWDRDKILYNHDFLRNYKPNQTYFFSKQNLQKLENAVKDLPIDTNFYKTNRRFLEILLIDLSYASSYLEWNTYSYLDTEILLKYNEISKEKSKEETQMILNHKRAIEYMIYYKKELDYTKKSFSEIHSLLGENLLLKNELWVIRNHSVGITWTTYTPIDNKFQLEQELEIFLEKLEQIKNPFEQSIFIMTFIPYFQLFADVNKRTSRIISNLPLIKHNLPVLSMIQLEKKKYIVSILSIYELNDINLLQNIWTENYLLNLKKYKENLIKN